MIYSLVIILFMYYNRNLIIQYLVEFYTKLTLKKKNNIKNDINIPNDIIYAEYKNKDITNDINKLIIHLNKENLLLNYKEYLINSKDVIIMNKNSDLISLYNYLNIK